jgi:DNA-binding transcriptional regulator WhiA
MAEAWNKGLTKENNISVRKTSETMKRAHLDNLKTWRDKMKAAGKIRTTYPPLKKNGDLAELTGVVLGDGHICKFPRCECLRIIGNSKNSGFIERYARLIEKVFGKTPTISRRKSSGATNITIYEKSISKRLNIPSGARLHNDFKLPTWITDNKTNRIRFLRGLYEAEGSVSHHEKTYTHKFLFTNKNTSLLTIVLELMTELGFHTHYSSNKVQISRQEDVQKAINLLRFRCY